MKVRINKKDFEMIKKWSVEDFPREACGFMLGSFEGWGWNVAEVVKVPNRSSSDIRFQIAPEDYLEWSKKAQSKGVDIVGVWHSHPDYPPRPSQYDIESAFEGYIYIILSVMAGKPAGVIAWHIVDGKIEQVEIQFVD